MKTAVITVYKKPCFLRDNVERLKKEHFDIVVAADEPDEEVIKIINEYGLKATISEKRRGKWKALNDALKLADGELLLFLDSDTLIYNLSGLNGADVIEILKEVRGESVIERLAAVDYLVMSAGAKVASRLGSCLSVNGAAFLVKRKVVDELGGFRAKINEDTEFGVRAGLRGYRYAVCGRAITSAPKTFKEWLKQRERWSVGGAEVLVENFFEIIRRPRLWIPYLIFFYPAIFGFLVSLILPESYFAKFLYLFLPFIALVSPKLASMAILAVYEMETIRNFLAAILSFFAWSSFVVCLSKKLDYRIELKLLPVYYFIYSPLWAIICFVSLVKVVVIKAAGRKLEVRDWVV